MLHAAVTVKGVNAVVFNGEEVLGRGAASEHPPRNFELHWEAYALQRLFSKTGGGIKREEFMLGASLNVLACSGQPGGVRGRLRSLLASLHLQRLDFLLLQIPREDRLWSLAAQAQTLVEECEVVVGEGLTQYYGVGCSGFSVAAPGRGGQHLPSLFSALDASRGLAHRVRMDCISRKITLGNTVCLPLDPLDIDSSSATDRESVSDASSSSTSGGGGGGGVDGDSVSDEEGYKVGLESESVCDSVVAATGNATLPTPSKLSHSCVALGISSNLLNMCETALPLSASVLSATRSRGLATLALSPLDCLPSQEAVDAR